MRPACPGLGNGEAGDARAGGIVGGHGRAFTDAGWAARWSLLEVAQWNGGAEAKVAFCASTGCGLPLRVDDASGSGSGHVDTMRATPPGAGAGDPAP